MYKINTQITFKVNFYIKYNFTNNNKISKTHFCRNNIPINVSKVYSQFIKNNYR